MIEKEFRKSLANRISELTGKNHKYIYTDFITPIFTFFDEKIEEIQCEEQRELSPTEIEEYLVNGFVLDLKRKYKGELGDDYNKEFEENVEKFVVILHDMMDENEKEKWVNSMDVLNNLDRN